MNSVNRAQVRKLFFFIGKKLIQETLAFVFSDSNFDGYYKLRFSAQFFKMLSSRDIKTKENSR